MRIAATASDEITLSGISTVKSLEITEGHLIVLSSARLVVSDRLLVTARKFSVYGELLARDIVWSGEYLHGLSTLDNSESRPGIVIVKRSLLVQRGSTGYKKLHDIDILIERNFTIDSNLDTSAELLCANCRLENALNSTMMFTGLNLVSTSSSNDRFSSDGFRRGLINNGSVVVVLVKTSPSWSWDVRNYGNVTFVNVDYKKRHTIQFSSIVVVNEGTIESFACPLTLWKTALVRGRYNKSVWIVYSYPAAYISDYNSLPGYRSYFRYKDYIEHVFLTKTYSPRMWDGFVVTEFRLASYARSDDVWLGDVTTYGRVLFIVSNSYHSRFCLGANVRFSADTEVQLGYQWTSPSFKNTSLLLSDGGRVATFGGTVEVWAGHELSIPSNVENLVIGRLSVSGGVVNINSSLFVETDMLVGSTGTLSLRGNVVTVGATLAPSGKMYLFNTTLIVKGELRMTRGELLGTNNALVLQSGGRLEGSFSKIINGVDINIDAPSPSPCPCQGVVAEYFQYRVATTTTPRITLLVDYFRPGSSPAKGYIPEDFDNVSSNANFVRLESTLTRSSTLYWRSPLVFNVDDLSPNRSSPESFTYNYVVRWTTFLNVTQSGLYNFYFLAGHERARMWIDGSVVFRGVSRGPFFKEQTVTVQLDSGHRKLRLDNIQPIHLWSARSNILYVLYDGPGTPKQSLPDSRLSYCYRNATTRTDVYATPKWNLTPLSRLSVQSTGLILSRRSNVTIGSRGRLDIRSNVVWFSPSVHFLNYGVFSKSGSLDSAVVCGGVYIESGAGKQIFSRGSVEFKSSSNVGCGLVFWNNSAGGRWTDKRNWDPPRVPSQNDLVYVAAPGSYFVVIAAATKVTVSTLIIGGANSNPSLKINTGVTLSVSDHLQVFTDTLVVSGRLDASHFTWSGRSIESLSSGSVFVNQSMIVSKGSFNDKYLTNVLVVNRGNLTVDETLNDDVLYLSSSTLRNVGSMLIGDTRIDVTKMPSEIVNEGILVVDAGANGRRWQSNVTNFGLMVVHCRSCINGVVIRREFNGCFHNQGRFESYMTSLHFQNINYGKFVGGDIRIWGRPSVSRSFPYSSYGNWSAYVREIYSPPVIWNVRNDELTVTIRLYSNEVNSVNAITTYGYVAVNVYGYSGACILNVSGDVNFSLYSTLVLASSDISGHRLLLQSAMSIFNDVFIEKGWTLESSSSTLSSTGRLFVRESGRFIASASHSLFRIDEEVRIYQHGFFSLHSGQLILKSKVFIAGDFDIGNGSATFESGFEWTDGTFSGQNAVAILSKTSKISSDFVKNIDGVELRLERAPAMLTYAGVVAEYFQYRVSTSTTPQVNGFRDFYVVGQSPANGFVPQEFDDLSSHPNRVEKLSNLIRLPRRNGNGPLVYQPDGITVDTTSPDSFSYNYAVRYLAYWDVPSTGQYEFVFKTGEGRYRFWIDGVLLRTGGATSGFFSENTFSYKLSSGVHRLRIDLFVVDSRWNSFGSALVVYVKGPGMPKRHLQNLTYAYLNDSSLVYASRFLDNDSLSICKMDEEGLIVAQNAAGITVTNTGVLIIQSNVLWYAHASLSRAPPRVTNAGLINKTLSDGIATFYADYVDAGGRLVKHSGDIEFRPTNQSGRVVLWSNTAGGSWLDPSNWIPPRVPSAGDVVYVTARGTYTVIVASPSPISVRYLVVGGSSSYPSLLVEHLTLISVDHRFDMRGDELDVRSSIVTDHFTWSGRRIVGTPSSFSKASIVARRSFVVSKGTTTANPSKELENIELVNSGIMTVDETMAMQTIYCRGCRLVNGATGVIRIVSNAIWDGTANGIVPDDDGFAFGVVNYGLLVQVIRNGQVSFYWNVRNKGRLTVFSGQIPTVSSIRFRSVFSNDGKVTFYAVSIYFDVPKIVSPGPGGSWKIYGVPERQRNLASPQWLTYAATFNYGQYIENWYHYSTRDVYGEKPVWRNTLVTLSFGSVSVYTAQHFFTLQTFGYVRIDLPKQTRGSRIVFTNEMILSTSTLLYSFDSSSNDNNSIIFATGSRAKFGRLTYLRQSWALHFAENTSIEFSADLIVEAGCGVNISSSNDVSDVVIGGQLIVRNGATFNATRRRVLIDQALTLEGGRFALDDSTLVLNEKLFWLSGKIVGGRVDARAGVDASGQHLKSLDGVLMHIAAHVDDTSSGVIAEYFQYRLKTDRTPQRSRLLYFNRGCSDCSNEVPADFDDPNTPSTYARIESSLTREPTYNGHAPLLYSHGLGFSVDLTSPDSYTYNYAARFSAFLTLPVSGTYKFYLLGGYGESRLWIDDVMRLTSNAASYLTEYSTIVHLTAGFHRFRVDTIQSSSHWEFDNFLVVSISGRCIPKQPLTNDFLTYKRSINGSDVYAAPTFRVHGGDVCAGNESFSDLFDYDAGVSYAVVRGTGVFEAVRDSSIVVEKSGVLDVQSDLSWPIESRYNRTRLKILGLGGKSRGSGFVKLNALYDSRNGCTRVDSGSLDFGLAEGRP